MGRTILSRASSEAEWMRTEVTLIVAAHAVAVRPSAEPIEANAVGAQRQNPRHHDAVACGNYLQI